MATGPPAVYFAGEVGEGRGADGMAQQGPEHETALRATIRALEEETSVLRRRLQDALAG